MDCTGEASPVPSIELGVSCDGWCDPLSAHKSLINHLYYIHVHVVAVWRNIIERFFGLTCAICQSELCPVCISALNLLLGCCSRILWSQCWSVTQWCTIDFFWLSTLSYIFVSARLLLLNHTASIRCTCTENGLTYMCSYRHVHVHV